MKTTNKATMKNALPFFITSLFCLLVCTAQDLLIPAGSNWRKETLNTGYSGSAYIAWTGGNNYSETDVVAPADIIAFKFNVPVAGQTSSGGDTGGGIVDNTPCWTKGFDAGWDISKPVGYLAVGSLDLTRKAMQINTLKEVKETWAAARLKYIGVAAVTNIYLTSIQERDGECSYRVLVNGQQVLEFTNPRILNTTTPDYTPYTVAIKGVNIPKDANIQVDFKSNSNKLVPENGDFAWARGRWRSLSIGGVCTVPVNKWIGNDSNLSVADNAVAPAQINIFPNPASSIVSFSEKVNAEFYSINGQKVLTVSNAESANVSSLPKGIYQIKINNKITQKLIIN